MINQRSYSDRHNRLCKQNTENKKETAMKILIVGAGIIGSIYGWAFTEAGHEVTHLVRPGRAGQFPNAMDIDMYDTRKGHRRDFIGRYAIRLTETLQPADGYELVVVPTKHYKLIETLKQIVPLGGNADYLLLTQNWEGTQEIDAILTSSRYVYGDAKAGGAFQDSVLIATIASIDIGQVDGRHDNCLNNVIALCRSADIPTTIHENILHYLWVQYAITGGLWPALVKAGSLPSVLSNRQLGQLGVQAARECLEVVRRRGVDLTKYPETRMYMSTSPLALLIAGLVIKFQFRFNKVVQRSSLHGLGDGYEIKVFYDDLLNTGRRLGVDMPAMSSFEPEIQTFALQTG
jgi:2-dehydropantoate 2-reductase